MPSCSEYDTNLHLMVRDRSDDLGSVEYLFIVITPAFILTRNGSIC